MNETVNSKSAKIGIVTVSDRASAGTYEDRGGPAIENYFNEVLISPWEPVARLIPDDVREISETLILLADVEECSLIITTGGTCLLYTSDAADE